MYCQPDSLTLDGNAYVRMVDAEIEVLRSHNILKAKLDPFPIAFLLEKALMERFPCPPDSASKGVPQAPDVTQPASQRDNYERMKDCAAQADQIVNQTIVAAAQKRLGVAINTPSLSNWDTDASILGWGNHYSSKYERCYVAVSAISHSGQSPWSYEEVYDAFESKSLVIYTDNHENASFCKIFGDNSTTGNCNAARAFIDDHMKN